MKYFQRVLPICFLCALAGCGLNADKGILMAAGSYGDIALVYGQDELAPVARRFAGELNEELVFVIATEQRFAIDIYPPEKWELAKGYKNVVFLTQAGKSGPVDKALGKVISRATLQQLGTGGGGLVQRKDPWGTYQLLVAVVGPDRNSLGSLLHRSTERIRNLVEADARTRILRQFRYQGLATELMNACWNRYGFYMEIPAEFKVTQQGRDGVPGLEVMRTGPSRGLTVTWADTPDPAGMMKDTDALLELRRRMGEVLHHEQIVDSSLSWTRGVFGSDREGWTLDGAWSGNAFAGGGPFRSFFVADPAAGRVYCLDILVYAPGMDKMPLMRRLEAVASTFSTTRPRS